MAYDDLDPDQQDELKTAAGEFQTAVKTGTPEEVVRTYEALEELCDQYSPDAGGEDKAKPAMTVVIGAKPKPKGIMEGM